MSARTEAIAFRIWQFCEPREWDCTLREIADALGLGVQVANGVCKRKGWLRRLRAGQPGYGQSADRRHDMTRWTDNALDGGSYRQIIRELTT